jgi:hypothetical protein
LTKGIQALKPLSPRPLPSGNGTAALKVTAIAGLHQRHTHAQTKHVQIVRQCSVAV